MLSRSGHLTGQLHNLRGHDRGSDNGGPFITGLGLSICNTSGPPSGAFNDSPQIIDSPKFNEASNLLRIHTELTRTL